MGEQPGGGSGASHLSSLATNLTRGLTARRLFRVPPCLEGTMHLQPFLSSPGFEPRPYGIEVGVANHYTGWYSGSSNQGKVLPQERPVLGHPRCITKREDQRRSGEY
ncbi:hypothetical protein TNCV_2545651 [Trichonephila clavipes]|nr:hypothetical protein TNCV_2545651 [Trichonephila clavipes]